MKNSDSFRKLFRDCFSHGGKIGKLSSHKLTRDINVINKERNQLKSHKQSLRE